MKLEDLGVPSFEALEPKRTILTLQRFGMTYMDLDVQERVVRDEAYMARRHHFLVEVFGEVRQEVEVQYPSTWWDALKARFFPEWLRRRYPPRLERVVLRQLDLRPDIPTVRHMSKDVYTFEEFEGE